MRQITLFSFALILMLGNSGCSAQGGKKPEPGYAVSAKVEVYYFHYTRRCATCIAVEENARKAVETMYPDKLKKGEYSFRGINLDEDNGKAIADKLGIGGQTLIVVCGDKKIDITDKGFMNANDLEKMKEEVKKAIDLALKG